MNISPAAGDGSGARYGDLRYYWWGVSGEEVVNGGGGGRGKGVGGGGYGRW